MDESITIKAQLIAEYGEVLTTPEATALYNFEGFQSPFAVVTRKSDGTRGALEFTHSPRFYFNFQEI